MCAENISMHFLHVKIFNDDKIRILLLLTVTFTFIEMTLDTLNRVRHLICTHVLSALCTHITMTAPLSRPRGGDTEEMMLRS